MSPAAVTASHHHRPSSAPHRPANEMPTPPAKPKVLVVDDEHVIADTLTIILKQSGFEAQAAYDGETSVKAAASFRPDMLLTDVIMSGMTGIDAAIEISRLLPNCRILLFSGQAATADLMDCARANGHDFDIVPKPLHPTDLLARLRA